MPKSAPEDIERRINAAKIRKIVTTTRYFLYENPAFKRFHLRFDALIIDLPGFPPVYHLEGAFEG
jgi:putative endonuclease